VLKRELSKFAAARILDKSWERVTLFPYSIFFFREFAGWLTLSRQIGRKARITHCAAKLEASGVHVGTHGPIQLENAERQKSYDAMHATLHEKGLQLGNTITQGLKMDDLFQVWLS
jgi:hypothetical protein